MTMSPTKLHILLMLCGLWSQAPAQELRSYKYLKVLSGQSIDVAVESNVYPEYIRRPKQGVVAKFKYGYEEVYRVRYTASQTQQGLDTVIYKTQRRQSGVNRPFFEGFIVEIGRCHAESDYFQVDVNSGTSILNLTDNDLSISGDLLISKLTYVSSGSASIAADKKSIRFTPSITGYARIGYSVCENGQCSSGSALIRVDDRTKKAVNDTSHYVLMRDESVTFMVGPGFSPPSTTYYSGSLTRIEPQIYHYQPPLGYSGTEVLRFFKFVDGFQFMDLITVEVKDPFIENGWNLDDQVYTEVGNPVSYSLQENDLGGSITNFFTSGLKGTLRIEDSGRIIYTPPAGYKGQTKFQYESCRDGRCDIADVFVTVHNYEPLYEVVELYATKNQPLQIDYNVPIDQYHFVAQLTARNGLVTLSPDGKVVTYQPNQDFTGKDAFALQYCAGNQGFCRTVSIEILVQNYTANSCDDCVWPGDHNNDGQVDVQDAVVLATNLGYSGPSRGFGNSPYWFGQSASDWPEALIVGTSNLKYVDSNGDGSISTADLQPVGNHYLKAHNIIPTPPISSQSVPVSLNLLTPEVKAGDWAVVEVSLGTDNIPVSEMLGINFSLEVGSRFVDSSTINFVISENGLFDPINSVIAFVKSPQDGRIDVGIGKTDKQPITGHGVLGQIRFIVEEDLNGFRSLKDLIKFSIHVKRVGLHVVDQAVASLYDVETKMSLQVAEREPEIIIFPNPAQSWLQISGDIKSLQIVDLNGQVLRQIENVQQQSAMHVDISSFSNGLYFLQIQSKGGKFEVRKFEVFKP